MKKHLLLSLTFCFTLTMFSLKSPVQAHDDSANEIQKLLFGWRSAADAVTSYDVYLDVVINTLTEGKLVKAHEHQIRQRYQDGKWRVDLLRTHYRFADGREEVWESSEDILAFASNRDDRGVRFFCSRTHFGELKTPGGDRDTRAKLLVPQLYEVFKSHFYHETYWSILNERAKAGALSRQSDSIEVSLPTVASLLPHNHSKEDFLVRFQPGVPIPVQIRRGVMLADRPDDFSEFESEVAEVVDDIWVPVHVTRRVFSRDFAKDTNIPACEELLTVDRQRSRFNVDLLPEVFELPFPPGTVVYDKSKGENYVINDGVTLLETTSTVAQERKQLDGFASVYRKADGVFTAGISVSGSVVEPAHIAIREMDSNGSLKPTGISPDALDRFRFQFTRKDNLQALILEPIETAFVESAVVLFDTGRSASRTDIRGLTNEVTSQISSDGPDSPTNVFRVRAYLWALGRGISKHITEVTSTKDLEGSLVELVASGTGLIGAEGEWRLNIEPGAAYMVRRATFTSPIEKIEVENNGRHDFGTCVVPENASFKSVIGGPLDRSYEFHIDNADMSFNNEVFEKAKLLIDAPANNDSIIHDDTKESNSATIVGRTLGPRIPTPRPKTNRSLSTNFLIAINVIVLLSIFVWLILKRRSSRAGKDPGH